jgi:hypothetical protein
MKATLAHLVHDQTLARRDDDAKPNEQASLLKGQDPLAVARALLREAEEPENFHRPIRYPKKLGLA